MQRGDVLTWSAIVALALIAAGLGAWLGQRQLGPRTTAPTQATPAKPARPAAAATSTTEVIAPGQLLPSLRLPNLLGGPDRELAGSGRVRLLNYWASWCAPCRDEMPVLDAFAATQDGNGVEVVGIALDTRAEAQRFNRVAPVRFLLLLEAPGLADSSVRLGNQRSLLPFSVLIGTNGRLLKTHYGAFQSPEEVAAWVVP